jgi:hypothetical protein
MTGRALLDPHSADRLRKLCGMLGSDHDGERAAAARAADKLVRGLGLTWHQVIAPPIVPDHSPRVRSWRADDSDWCRMAQFCHAWRWSLSQREREFVESVRTGGIPPISSGIGSSISTLAFTSAGPADDICRAANNRGAVTSGFRRRCHSRQQWPAGDLSWAGSFCQRSFARHFAGCDWRRLYRILARAWRRHYRMQGLRPPQARTAAVQAWKREGSHIASTAKDYRQDV